MCGITGLINKNGLPVDKKDIKHMNDLISHRGPDSEGFYFESNLAFGHRRLSILDLTQDGHQPMGYLQKYFITYNGEIYNYLEIKEELISYGYSFDSKTDTEVILASYDKWGEKCVDKFNGMWAFAIHDKQKNIVFCSRDRFGVKPFYYTQTEDKFAFGSEIKQLLVLKNPMVNIEVVVDYLVARMLENTNKTFFKNIFKLEPSSNLIYDLKTNKIQIYKYYDILKQETQTQDDPIKKYENELIRSIKIRLRSDVTVGSCLSGGLDSSSVATIASNMLHDNKFMAVHAKSIEKSSDESEYAKIVANNANLDLHIVTPNIEDFKNSIDEVVYTQEEPFGGPSIFMQYFVMKKAKEIGCKVMLDGQGGDETLLGYERYYPSIYIDIFKKHGLFSMIKNIILSSKNNSKMSFKNIMKYTFGSILSKLRKKAYMLECDFVKKEYMNDFKFLDELSKNYFDVFKLSKYEITYTNLPALLRFEDKNSMRHSVETRLPFLDYKALECALNTDSEIKIKDGWTKYILRMIIKDKLPQNVVFRKNKLGFNAPDKSWISSIDSQIISEIKNSKIINKISNIDALLSKIDKINDLLKFRLYSIAVWERVYNVKID